MTNCYENGKIYKLTNTVTDDIYIGSTTNELKYRLTAHRIAARQNGNSVVYQWMQGIGSDQFAIELIEDFACKNRQELEQREHKLIKQQQPSLNTYCKSPRKQFFFKDYYADANFRTKHLKYMSTKVACECGYMTARGNMSRHKAGKVHQKLLNE